MRRTLLLLLLGAGVAPAQLPLSLKKAMEMAAAPDGNVRVALAREAIAQAEARRGLAAGALLPVVDSSFAYQNFTRNLSAFGVRISVPLPGFTFPTLAGPFDSLDIRGSAAMPLLDLAAWRRLKAAQAQVSAVKQDLAAATRQTEGAVARAYVNALRAEAAVDAARANVALAERVLKLARSQKDAGTGTGLDITRAEVQAANEAQRLLAAQEDRRIAVLQLLRLIGIAMDGEVQLTDRLRDEGPVSQEAAQVVALARQHRAELAAQQDRVRGARLQYESTKLDRLPAASAFGDYGTTGLAGESLQPTHTFGISVKIPVFNGKANGERRAEAGTLLRMEEIRARDAAQQVELEARTALATLESAAAQAKVAREALRLSEKELEQSQRRYEAGVASSLELTDAQTRVARSREAQAASLARYNAALVDLDIATAQTPSIAQ